MTDITAEELSGSPTRQRPLGDVFKIIAESEDMDTAFIIAGVVNLYFAMMRRKVARTDIGPDDVQKIFSICRTLLTATDLEQDIGKYVQRRRNGNAEQHA